MCINHSFNGVRTPTFTTTTVSTFSATPISNNVEATCLLICIWRNGSIHSSRSIYLSASVHKANPTSCQWVLYRRGNFPNRCKKACARMSQATGRLVSARGSRPSIFQAQVRGKSCSCATVSPPNLKDRDPTRVLTLHIVQIACIVLSLALVVAVLGGQRQTASFAPIGAAAPDAVALGVC